MSLKNEVNKIIRRNKKVAADLFEKTHGIIQEISRESFDWLEKNGWVFRRSLRSNLTEFFANYVVRSKDGRFLIRQQDLQK